MKAKIFLPIILLGILALGGCTQNNGHIGRLFGAWVMTEMTVDGVEKVFPDDVYTSMAFQSGVVRFDYHYAHNSRTERYGSWVETDNNVTFNFTHSDDNTTAGTGHYAAPDWLDLPQKTKIDMTIADCGGGRLTLVYATPDGKTIIYKFERTW